MHTKKKRTLGNLLLLGVFTFFALGSSSSKGDLQQYQEDFQKGWELGEKIHETFSQTTAEPADSIIAVPEKEYALK